ncbi:hypothetical protein PoB_001219500 [Plakobranchus ocellatus]|uniref:Uncharacterized protein n=1 Tax=Plakobranchus ocellatus TaxID=259542 RepID=A0AAV3YTC6_9GAST|nr:hypothetical protein PoB_001219500 [Plakobranchus ocellatus]
MSPQIGHHAGIDDLDCPNCSGGWCDTRMRNSTSAPDFFTEGDGISFVGEPQGGIVLVKSCFKCDFRHADICVDLVVFLCHSGLVDYGILETVVLQRTGFSIPAVALCAAFYSGVFSREDAFVVGNDNTVYIGHATVANFIVFLLITLCKMLVLGKQVLIKVRNFFPMLVATFMEYGGLNHVILLALTLFLRKYNLLLSVFPGS